METNALNAMRRLISGELSALIFERPPYYVQFAAAAANTLMVEAVGEANLEERLTPDQLRRLHDFGFRLPAKASSGNHSKSIPAEAGASVALAFAVMAEVFRASPFEVRLTEV